MEENWQQSKISVTFEMRNILNIPIFLGRLASQIFPCKSDKSFSLCGIKYNDFEVYGYEFVSVSMLAVGIIYNSY